MLLAATATRLCLVLALPAIAGQHFINSFAGPFDIELQRIEMCPTTTSGLNLLNFTERLTRDRNNPKLFFYTGVAYQSFTFLRSTSATIRLSSWSARGGWKENAYQHTFPRICELARARIRSNSRIRAQIHAALGSGSDPFATCPFPASRWEFTDFPVDVSADEFKEFVYGKWRVDIQAKDGKTVLSCYRLFVETVPRVQRRAPSPADTNYTGTLRISGIPSLYP